MTETAVAVRDVLSSVDAGRVLEIGAGDGEFTEVLVERLASFTAIEAVDIDETDIGEARRYFAAAHPQAPVVFTPADAARLPFEGGSFDTVVLSNTVHHLAEPQRALGEVLRVLRDGGRLIVHEMVADAETDAEAVGRDLHHLKARIDRTQGLSHNPTLSRARLAALLDDRGLAPLRRLEYRPAEPEAAAVDLDEKLARLDEYADYAAADPDYAGIRREVSRLKQRVRAVGFAPAPQILVMYEKRPGRQQ
jgi:SAM-dependent methyltransferase